MRIMSVLTLSFVGLGALACGSAVAEPATPAGDVVVDAIRGTQGHCQDGHCTFDDGSSCTEVDFYAGHCVATSAPRAQAGGTPAAATENTPPAAETPSANTAQLANPASTFCGQNGGRTVIVDTGAGQRGDCVFPNGRTCEEWAYFRGSCHP